MSNVRFDTDANNHVDQELARRQVEWVSTGNLYRLSVPVPAEIRPRYLA